MSRIVLGFLLALATLSPAGAQEWPTRTITLVVPFTPGGGRERREGEDETKNDG